MSEIDVVAPVTVLSRARYVVRPPRAAPRTGASGKAERFRDVLETVSGPLTAGACDAPARHTVQRGETLSRICEQALRQQGASRSRSDIYAAVSKVVKANGIQNPDLILIGQEIDLSVLHDSAGMGGRASGAAVPSTKRGLQVKPASEDRAVWDAPSRDLAELLGRVRAVYATKASADATVAVAGAVTSPIMDGPVRITSGFGMRRDPFTGRPEHHDGVDLAAPSGTPVHPAMAGEVVFSGWQRGYGRMVIIQHQEGFETVYAHNAKNLVNVGDRVGSSTPVAQVGSSGRSTGPHVHFEVRRNGRAVDPMPYLSAGRVRIAKAS